MGAIKIDILTVRDALAILEDGFRAWTVFDCRKEPVEHWESYVEAYGIMVKRAVSSGSREAINKITEYGLLVHASG